MSKKKQSSGTGNAQRDRMMEIRAQIHELLGEVIRLSTARSLAESRVVGFYDAVAEYERSVIIAALRTTVGVQRDSAKLLGLPSSTLHRKMKKLNIRLSDYK